MNDLDNTLARAWAIFDEDLSDETDKELEALLPPLVDAGYVLIDGESPSGHFWRFTPAGVGRAVALGLDVPWRPPPPSFHGFLSLVLSEIPEFRPIADEQLELSDGEYYSTRFFDAFSSAVMECQGRIMDGKATARDAEVVESWLRLGEQAMVDPFVAESFLETAGDDFLLDRRGQALRDRTGPELGRALEKRRASIDEAIRRSKAQENQHGAGA